jgi:hypothetical protein
LAAAADVEFFEARVRPVLAKNCYSCHAAEKQFSGLRVDSREALLKGGKRGAAVVPGAASESLLVRAIRHESGVAAMPMGSKLKADEIAAVEEWVKAGAVWPASAKPATADWYERAAKTHWSFQPVKNPVPPVVRNTAWPRNEIDRFILAALEAKGLAPAGPADQQTLARRTSLVLTGLPSVSGDIDSLIASPHFGEQFARHWMDVMRYGETRGYEWNYEIVGAWRYRDYLIRAFNSDVPFDQLVREHVAGDLLEKPRINARERINESIIGTTFFRLGEAGHDDCIKFRELSLDVVDNQIDTLGKAFQGLTLSCARCHNHKLDPIPTDDYYGLFGILNSSRAVTHTIDTPAPVAPELLKTKDAVRAELGRVWISQVDSLRPDAKKAAFDDPMFPWLAMRNTEAAQFAEVWQRLAALYNDEMAVRAKFNRANFTAYTDMKTWFSSGLGLRAASAGDITPATEGDRVLTAMVPAGLHTNLVTDRWNGALRSPLLPKTHKYISLRLMGGRLASRRTVLDNCAIGEGYKTLENDSPKWMRLDTISAEKLPAFVEVITKFDNPRIPDRPGMLKESPAELAAPRSYFGAMGAVLHDTPETPREELGHLARLFDGPAPASLEELAARYRMIAKRALAAQTDDDVRWLDSLLRHGLLSNDRNASPKLAELVAAYRGLEAKLPAPRVVDGMADAGEGFDTPVLVTGDPHSPGAIAPRHFLSRIGNAASLSTHGSGRRELAEILASPSNPLTARVIVNRVWHAMFGRGLVGTPDNFGREGERPSNPELLDYLATRFMNEGWSIKKLVRLIASSQTFQQAGGSNNEADPRNILLSHFPARRLPAESVRDSILNASGRLDPALYGQSIAPPRNDPQDYRRLFNGPLDGAGRRSIYTQITRMEGFRFLEIFDYPNPMAARGSRDVTNVPAQALAMLNDPFVLDQARVWGERLARDGAASPEERIDSMFRTALGRPATPSERARFTGLAAEVASLQGVPRDSPTVWRDVAHAVFNLKEFVYIR